MTNKEFKFDELVFFAQVKKRPGLFFGNKSLLSLKDQMFGMQYAFSFYCDESPLKYFHLFVRWYDNEIIQDLNGYACWWNHILYLSGNDDILAFDTFLNLFERYLRNMHNVCLPDVP